MPRLYLTRNLTIALILLTIVVFLEFFGFYHYAHLHITAFYPTNFDQTSYLPMAYSQYLTIKKLGLISGLPLAQNLPSGPLFIWQTIPWFLIFGASRFSALGLNFFYFLILQSVIISLVWRYTKAWSLCALALGLIFLLHAPFNGAGGLFDFRIDFMALCLYGITIATVLMSRIFLDRNWVIIAALAGGCLTLLRVITCAYLFFIFGVLLVIWLISYYLQPTQRELIKSRLKNLLLYQGIIFLFVVPFLWINRQALYNYYIVGHITGKEKYIRALSAGVHDWVSNLLFYPDNILTVQLGQYTHTIILSVLLIGILFAIFLRRTIQNGSLGGSFGIGCYYLTLAFAAPLMVLTADTSKSTVVAGITTIPLILLTLWIWMGVITSLKQPLLTTLFKAAAIYIVLLSISYQRHHYDIPMNSQQQQTLNTITHVYDQIGSYAVNHQWKNVNLSVDQILDYLASGAIETLYYERHGILLNVNIQALGGSIFSINEARALNSLKRSNVVIFEDDNKEDFSYYPLNASVQKLKTRLLPYIHKHFKTLTIFTVDNKSFHVYVR